MTLNYVNKKYKNLLTDGAITINYAMLSDILYAMRENSQLCNNFQLYFIILLVILVYFVCCTTVFNK